MNRAKQLEMFNIKQVSDITGLSKQVIRKWEERYQVVAPERLANGRRIYNGQDIQTLLAVRKLTEEGCSVSLAAETVKRSEREKQVRFDNPTVNEYFFRLLEKGTYCDELELNLLLKQAHQQLGLNDFLSELIIPFLNEVGDRWEKREWSEYQESVSSMVVRDYLVQIRRNYPYREEAPLIMGACLPGEHHEVPLQIILLQAMVRGWKSFLIGSSPAMGSIESLINQFQPGIVLLSATTSIPFDQNPSMLDHLELFASKHPSIRFFIGGPGAIEHLKNKGGKYQHLTLANSLEEVMKEVG